MKFALRLTIILSFVGTLLVPAESQNIQLIAGYTLNQPQIDNLNQSIAGFNTRYEPLQRSLKPINYFHGATFGIRRRWDRGFYSLSWEEKSASSKAERVSNSSTLRERLSLVWTSLNFETAFTLDFISFGAGIQGFRYKTAIDASYNEKKERISRQFGLANSFFVELAIGKSSTTQLALRPFYQFNWEPIDYSELHQFLTGDSTPIEDAHHFLGISLLIRNGQN